MCVCVICAYFGSQGTEGVVAAILGTFHSSQTFISFTLGCLLALQYFTQFLIGADDPSQESKYSCFPYRNLPGKMRRFNVVIELNSATGTHRAVTGLPELVERHCRKLP